MMSSALQSTLKKVLLVEDVDGMREVLAEKLSREGFYVIPAGDGQEGFRLALQEQPDLIVSDILMPRVNGVEMVEKLRHHHPPCNIPVIFLSILSEREHRNLIEHLPHVLEYLWKNELSLEEIVREIKRLWKQNGFT